MLHELRLRLWRNLGGCPYCIRKAFQAAVLAWGVAFALFAIGAGAPPLAGSSAVASGLSALWIAHILAFAAKKVSRATKVVRTDDYSSRSMSRRDLVVCPACSIAWGWKSPIQPDGGEGLAKHKGVIARWGLKAVRSKTAA